MTEELTAFAAMVFEEVESALADELREHAVRLADVRRSREVNLVIELER
ncbi:MAG TPA: hypothetical protein VGO75_16020 [Gemmatimonadaceae bacterium]|nr:hypothetical protein [Gemmatimonadaceae bacterium]